jgi:hypothetical protein
VSLYDRVRVGPLWTFIVAAMLLFFALFHGLPWLGHVLLSIAAKRTTLSPWWESANDTFEALSPQYFWRDPGALLFDWAFACVLLGSLGMLLLFRETLGLRRIRNAQVFRVVAYSALPGTLVAIASFAVTLFVADIFASTTRLFAPLWVRNLVMLLAIATPFGLLLSNALRRYLRLPHPRALGVTAAFVGLLAAVSIPAGISQLFR